MKLANALSLRSELQTRIRQLESRTCWPAGSA